MSDRRLRVRSLLGCLVWGVPLCLAPWAGAQVSFNWLTIGNPGNPADTLVMDKGPAADFTTGYGSVAYSYRIAKDLVTNSQYVTFLNAVDPNGTNALKLYDARMMTNSLGLAYTGGINLNTAAPAGSRYSVKSGQANFPATWVTFQAGARFANWLQNGQGSGGTETGAYNVPATNSNVVPTRQPGATFFMPSENEYYKAAYYDPTKNGGAGGYWQYGIRSDTAPVSSGPPGGATSANYSYYLPDGSGRYYWQNNGGLFDTSLNYLTPVGAYTQATSYYGLSDADGQVYNWVDGAVRTTQFGSFPIYRGGAFYYDAGIVGAAYRNIYSFANVASYAWFGLRIGSAVPQVVSASWNVDADGAWGTAGNWSGGVPDGTGASATFGGVTTSARTISLGANRTVGALSFSGTRSYTLSGTQTLTLDASSGAATVTVASGNHVLAAPVALADATTVSVAAGSTLSFTGGLAAGANALSVSGGGSVVLSGTFSGTGSVSVTSASLQVQRTLRPLVGALTVSGSGAVANLAAAPTPVAGAGFTVAGEFASVSVSASGRVAVPAVSRAANKGSLLITSSLTVGSGGVVDLGNSDLLVRGGNVAAIRALVAAGSVLASGSQPASAFYLPYTALAVFPNDGGDGQPFYETFDGVTVSAADVLVKYTYRGDTDIDGDVDAHDLANALEGFSTGATGWRNGDFDYDGVVTAADLGLLITARANQGAPFSWATGGGAGTGAIPEPAGLALLALATAPLARRRRR